MVRARTTLTEGVGPEATQIRVTSPWNLPTSPPFFVYISTEILKVTAISGHEYTVQRAQNYSSARSLSAGSSVFWRGIPPAVQWTWLTPSPHTLPDEWRHNLQAQKMIGYLLAAIALAGDDSRAAEYAEGTWNYYYDLLYPLNKDYWSGPTQGGLVNCGYQWGRWHYTHIWAGLVGRNAFDGAQIDILDSYFWRGLLTPALWSPPNGSSHWRRMPVDPSSGEPCGSHHLAHAAMASTLNPGTQAEYALYYFRNLAAYAAGDIGLAPAVPLAAYAPEDATATDFRETVPPWNFHTETDFGSDSYFGIVVSKTDWGTAAAMVLAGLGVGYSFDHDVDQGVNVVGPYAIFKGSKLLFGWDSSYGVGGSATTGNWFELGGSTASLKSNSYPPWFTNSAGGRLALIDRKHGDQDYVYARGNHTGAFKPEYNVTRQHRHVVHIKGEPDYFIVFDDSANTGTARQRRTRLFYHRTYDAGSEFTANEDYTQIVFKKPTGQAAMISTRVLFPDGGNPTRTPTTTTNSYGVVYDWGNVNGAQMLVVHRVALGTNDQMPAVRSLSGLDAQSLGVEVLDPSSPMVFVVPRSGEERNQCSFQTTHSGEGRILIVGLLPGRYEVYRDGQRLVGSPFTVTAGDGTLFMRGAAGSYTVSGSPPAELGVTPDLLNFHFTIGGAVPPPQTSTATCTGGECLALAEESCPWLSVSPASGPTPQVFTVGVEPSGLPEGSYSCTIMVSAVALGSPKSVRVELRVSQAGSEPLEIVTEGLPTGAVGEEYRVRLEARGGRPPYRWSLRAGALPDGLSLTEEGEIVGVPAIAGRWEIEVQVTDSEEKSGTAIFVVVIQPVLGGEPLSAKAAGATADRLVIRYGKLKLEAGRSCSWEISDSPSFSRILDSGTDAGGPSRRVAVGGGPGVLSPGTSYYVRVACGSESAQTTAATKTSAPVTSKTVRINTAPPAAAQADRIRVEFGNSPSLGQIAEGLCTSRCQVDLQVETDSVLYFRYSYLRADGSVVSTSPLAVMVVPR